MNRAGHVGIAIAVYAPLGFLVARTGAGSLAIVGAATTAALAPLPDVDNEVPLASHRGASHTVWFAVVVAVVLGGIGRELGTATPLAAPAVARRVGWLVGLSAIGSHLAGDALTHAGVRPLAPVGPRVAFGWVSSGDGPIDRVLLWLGIGVLSVALWIGTNG